MRLYILITFWIIIALVAACDNSLHAIEKPDKGEQTFSADKNGRVNIFAKQGSLIAPGTIIYLRGNILSARLEGLQGTPEKPIIVTNYPGEIVVIGEPNWKGGAYSNALQLLKSKHVILGGKSGTSSFVLHGPIKGGYFALSLQPYTDCIEVKNLTIRDCANGIVAKTDPAFNDPKTNHPNTILESLIIHDLEIYNVDGEAMYIGHTAPYWGWDDNGKGFNAGTNTSNPICTYVRPIMWTIVKVYNNKIHKLLSAGIQISNTVNVEIFNNEINGYGMSGVGGHSMGIVIGNNCTNTNTYDNYVNNGNGDCLQFHGAYSPTGKHIIKNNLFTNTTSDGIAISGLNTNGTVVEIINNTIVNCKKHPIKVNGREMLTHVNSINNVFINCTPNPSLFNKYHNIMHGGSITDKNNVYYKSILEAKVDANNYYTPLSSSTIGTAGYHRKK